MEHESAHFLHLTTNKFSAEVCSPPPLQRQDKARAENTLSYFYLETIKIVIWPPYLCAMLRINYAFYPVARNFFSCICSVLPSLPISKSRVLISFFLTSVFRVPPSIHLSQLSRCVVSMSTWKALTLIKSTDLYLVGSTIYQSKSGRDVYYHHQSHSQSWRARFSMANFLASIRWGDHGRHSGGKFTVVFNDEDRENEGYQSTAADHIPLELTVFVFSRISGVISCAIATFRLNHLQFIRVVLTEMCYLSRNVEVLTLIAVGVSSERRLSTFFPTVSSEVTVYFTS